MKLAAKAVPYSSVVGGGLSLHDASGAARFMVIFCGTTAGITKEENAALASQFAALIERDGLEVPDREKPHGD